ncbi:hypothetical protein PVAP13_3KG433301 [Panicum virgatum]|uniref:Uncharacterized protein n=1 Tax=Panicum virgatum TaxID=38727 RepID=A0A8T0V458_PANVG|nr:hypothetical protein PVAP13_3KG433301 [Panicum virgatum]
MRGSAASRRRAGVRHEQARSGVLIRGRRRRDPRPAAHRLQPRWDAEAGQGHSGARLEAAGGAAAARAEGRARGAGVFGGRDRFARRGGAQGRRYRGGGG